jgi:hypothetical protein
VTVLADSQRAEAVAAFDSRFGEMERVLWHLSKNCRAALLAGESSPVIESLVWAIKSWWGVMGVRSEAKAQMSSALAVAVDWSPALFDPLPSFEPGAADRAAGWVDELVGRSMEMGVPNRPYSLHLKGLALAASLASARLRPGRPRGGRRPGHMGPAASIRGGRDKDVRDGARRRPGRCVDRPA